MDTTEFAKRLKMLRLEAGLTQMQAAKLLGISNTALSQYESGKRTPGMNALSALAGVYHIPLSYLLNGEEETAAVINENELKRLMNLKGREPSLFDRFCSLSEEEDELLASLNCLLGRITSTF